LIYNIYYQVLLVLHPAQGEKIRIVEGVMPSTNDILAIILGGGRGARLYPLTQQRSKPAVPMAGKYRLIDIPISNCINSGIYRIAVLTQFNSVSLHRHITRTYEFDRFHPGWVQVWAAEQTIHTSDWYQGTADAVRKQLFEIRSSHAKYVLVLAGDHLYRMDYDKMAQFHWENNADITVAVQPVPLKEAPRLGILKRDTAFRITQFAEKPKDPALQASLVSRNDPARPLLGSMGIYMFNTSVLVDLLENSNLDDFGNHVIPSAINTHRVFGYDFEGYWEDIGTIRSFYDTNLALAGTHPPFDFFDPERPIYTHPRFLPCSTVENSALENVLLAEGCCVKDSLIRRSVIGVRSQVRKGCRIEDTIMMGSDYYDRPCIEDESLDEHDVPIGVGSFCRIKGAIIDKNARVGKNVVIQPFPPGTDIDEHNWVVRDGIVVIPKNAVLAPGTVIKP
jgi:glucose-1-phosphate adenylyltransferase